MTILSENCVERMLKQILRDANFKYLIESKSEGLMIVWGRPSELWYLIAVLLLSFMDSLVSGKRTSQLASTSAVQSSSSMYNTIKLEFWVFTDARLLAQSAFRCENLSRQLHIMTHIFCTDSKKAKNQSSYSEKSKLFVLHALSSPVVSSYTSRNIWTEAACFMKYCTPTRWQRGAGDKLAINP